MKFLIHGAWFFAAHSRKYAKDREDSFPAGSHKRFALKLFFFLTGVTTIETGYYRVIVNIIRPDATVKNVKHFTLIVPGRERPLKTLTNAFVSAFTVCKLIRLLLSSFSLFSRVSFLIALESTSEASLLL